jgi:hypothetical protein
MFEQNYKTPRYPKQANKYSIRVILMTLISVIIPACTNTTTMEPVKKLLADQAWLSTSGSRNFIVKASASDVTESVREQDGKIVSLQEKQVPTDFIDEQTLLVSFKDVQLPGSYIFRISTGSTTGIASAWLDVDEFSLIEKNGQKSLNIVYKANESFPIDILYSRDPEFRSIWLNKTGLTRSDFLYAFPISLSMIGTSEFNISGNVISSTRWNTAIIPLPPELLEQAKLINEAQQFLEELNNTLSIADKKNEGMFLWDETLLTETAIDRIAEKYTVNGRKPTVRLFYGIKEISTGLSAPIINQDIVVQTRDGKLKKGEIGISY